VKKGDVKASVSVFRPGPARVLNNQAIIVLGMHRSGTSALTRVLNLHGMELGPTVMVPQADNESGFWEHQDIVDVHDDILKMLRSSWDDEILSGEWWLKKSLRPYVKKLAQILVRDFSQYPLWGIKDPRMCRLLPLWVPLLKRLNCEPVFALAIRHPFEVAKSLEKRNGFSIQKGERLWFEHTLLLERSSRGFPRVIVPYEHLLTDWKKVINRVQSALKTPWPKTPLDSEIEQFIKPAMRHYTAPETSNLSSWTLQTYRAFLTGLTEDVEAMGRELDSIYPMYEGMRWFLGDLQAQLLSARTSNGQLRHELRLAQTSIARLNSKILKNGSRPVSAKVRLMRQKVVWRSGVIETTIRRWISSGRSWFKRIFDRWDPPGADPVAAGGLRQLIGKIFGRAGLYC
jgi:hypothetical protein